MVAINRTADNPKIGCPDKSDSPDLNPEIAGEHAGSEVRGPKCV